MLFSLNHSRLISFLKRENCLGSEKLALQIIINVKRLLFVCVFSQSQPIERPRLYVTENPPRKRVSSLPRRRSKKQPPFITEMIP